MIASIKNGLGKKALVIENYFSTSCPTLHFCVRRITQCNNLMPYNESTSRLNHDKEKSIVFSIINKSKNYFLRG